MAKLPTKPWFAALTVTAPVEVKVPRGSLALSLRRFPISASVSRTTVFTAKETPVPDCSDTATDPATAIA
jgi:hypothetical protein